MPQSLQTFSSLEVGGCLRLTKSFTNARGGLPSHFGLAQGCTIKG